MTGVRLARALVLLALLIALARAFDRAAITVGVDDVQHAVEDVLRHVDQLLGQPR